MRHSVKGWLGALVGIVLPMAAHAQVEQKRFEGTYLHRSRGRDYARAKLMRQTSDDGTAVYSVNLRGTAYSLATDGRGQPIEYKYSSPKGYTGEYAFSAGEMTVSRRSPKKPHEELSWTVSDEALPDFNSRPDPYLTQHLLIKAYDVKKCGKQTLRVYDVDSKAAGVREYEITLELTDEDGVRLPNGRFKAKHFVQVQQSGGGTWYKKARGSQTDVWVNDDLVILRIYRHREPYEVILQDYDNARDLMAPTETAQAYPRPERVKPDPLPRYDLSTIPGELVFEGAYQHRNRGYDWFVGSFFVKKQADGTVAYVSELEKGTYIATANRDNVPIEYRYVSREDPKWASTTTFSGSTVTRVRKWEKPGENRLTQTMSEGSLPDYNSRPDPYCIQHVLLRRYDFAKGGRQAFTVFDGDRTGKSLAEYQVALDYRGDEEIAIPAGKFRAKHLVLTQLTPSNTWYKKYQGLETDFWIGDDYTVYRILRHREPYGVVLIERKR